MLLLTSQYGTILLQKQVYYCDIAFPVLQFLKETNYKICLCGWSFEKKNESLELLPQKMFVTILASVSTSFAFTFLSIYPEALQYHRKEQTNSVAL
jgi:hypothetical protein